MELKDRLRTASKAVNLSQSELARRCGVEPSAINHIESGRTKSLSGDLLSSLSRELKVIPDWLSDERGPMRGMIYFDLPGASNIEAGPDITGQVPLISWVQAGAWCEAIDTFQPGDAEEWLNYPKKNGSNVYALRVRGDSMTAPHGKTYPDGCVIFVDPDRRSPVSGERIIAKLDGVPEVTFKVFMQDAGRTWLRPLNQQHPPIFDSFKVLGTVVGKWEDE